MAGSPPRILVTRPQPGASRTAAALQDAGFEPLILPVTEIVPVKPSPAALNSAASASIIAVTSANALRHAPETLLDTLRDKPLFAVGDATAAMAQECGFNHVASAGGDAEALAALIISNARQGDRIIYLCGRSRTGGLEDGLRDAGWKFALVEVYDTQIVSQLTYEMTAILDKNPPDGIMVHAGTAAAALAAQTTRAKTRYPFDNIPFFVISHRAAMPLHDAGIKPVIISTAPTDASMIDALRAHWAL